MSIAVSSQCSAMLTRLGLESLDPERIGVEHEERFIPQIRQRMDDAAARIEQLRPFVGNDDSRRDPSCQMRLDLVGEIMDIDDRRLNVGACQGVQRVIDQCLAANPHQRLGYALGDRPHPLAKAGGKQHRMPRNPGRRIGGFGPVDLVCIGVGVNGHGLAFPVAPGRGVAIRNTSRSMIDSCDSIFTVNPPP